MIYEQLSKHVDFTEVSEAITQSFASAAREIPGAQALVDLTHLNAAEAATLWPRAVPISETQSVLPLAVPAEAAYFAISATDSGPMWLHDPTNNPKLWDVTLLGSDASKLAWISQNESVEALAASFTSVISKLGEHYGRINPELDYLGRARNTELFAVQAMLWRAKIAVLLKEENTRHWLPDVIKPLT
jgi:hypothetical protein